MNGRYDYIVHTDDGEDYLCHYGVKGMKWKKGKKYVQADTILEKKEKKQNREIPTYVVGKGQTGQYHRIYDFNNYVKNYDKYKQATEFNKNYKKKLERAKVKVQTGQKIHKALNSMNKMAASISSASKKKINSAAKKVSKFFKIHKW